MDAWMDGRMDGLYQQAVIIFCRQVHVSVRGGAAARVRLCVLRDPFPAGLPPPGSGFGGGGREARGAPGSSEPGAIHWGAFKVTEGGALTLSRNEVRVLAWRTRKG